VPPPRRPGGPAAVAQGVVGPGRHPDQGVHQLLAGGPVGTVASRLAGCSVVIVALPSARTLAANGGGQARSSPRMTPRSIVTVSWVVTASSSGAESSTRRTRPAPAGGPAGRSLGRSDPDPGSGAAGPADRPAPYARTRPSPPRPRRRPPGRVPPAHVEGEPVGRLPIAQPFSRCSTITTARIDGGTERRPVGSKRSANSSGGNSRVRSLARNRYTDHSGSAASHQRAPVADSSGRRSWRPSVTAGPPGPATTGRPKSASSASHRRIRHRTPAT
jgi:hypothetical protein